MKLVVVNLMLVVVFYIGYEVVQNKNLEFENMPFSESRIYRISNAQISAQIIRGKEGNVEGCTLKGGAKREDENTLKLKFKELHCDHVFMADTVMPEMRISYNKGCM